MDLYSGFIVVPHSQGAQVRITQCYLQITPYLPLPCKRSPDGASPYWGCGHLIAAYLSTTKGWKAESAWLVDLQRTVYPHKWSPVSCRSSAGQRKFAGQKPTFYTTVPWYSCFDTIPSCDGQMDGRTCNSIICAMHSIARWKCNGFVYKIRYCMCAYPTFSNLFQHFFVKQAIGL